METGKGFCLDWVVVRDLGFFLSFFLWIFILFLLILCLILPKIGGCLKKENRKLFLKLEEA